MIAAATIAVGAVVAVPAVAGAEGNAWGKDARECVAAFDVNLGQGIQAGKAAHEGAKMTPKTIAQSVHCAA
jgi:hypothetical protein